MPEWSLSYIGQWFSTLNFRFLCTPSSHLGLGVRLGFGCLHLPASSQPGSDRSHWCFIVPESSGGPGSPLSTGRAASRCSGKKGKDKSFIHQISSLENEAWPSSFETCNVTRQAGLDFKSELDEKARFTRDRACVQVCKCLKIDYLSMWHN